MMSSFFESNVIPPQFGKLFSDNEILSSCFQYLKEFDYPSPVGLCLGILAVIVVQILIVIYHYYNVFYGNLVCINNKFDREQSKKNFWKDLVTHVSNPEGFVLLGTYLTLTWMFRIMPTSYYSFSGGVNIIQVFQQLVFNDLIQTLMHLAEHKVSPWVYIISHKPHHRFISPKLFDAFNGSFCDTFFMILIPLACTAQVVHCNVWTYMAFGASFAGWLTLIHSEFEHPWDPLFRALKFGSASDHHVHHAVFNYNFGHLFMWWDCLFGTYRHPDSVKHFKLYELKNQPNQKKGN